MSSRGLASPQVTTTATAGIDVGNATSCVGLARGNAVDVVMNAEGLRETPTAVSYGGSTRAVGFQASSRCASKPRSTVVHVKRLAAMEYTHLRHSPKLLYDVQEDAASGACTVSVEGNKRRIDLSPVQVLATVIKDLKHTAESNAGTSQLARCVLSIPCYYGQDQRRAVLAAAQVAGLPDVSLMHDLTAAALSWSTSRADLHEERPLKVAFIDVGHSATQVSPGLTACIACEERVCTWACASPACILQSTASPRWCALPIPTPAGWAARVRVTGGSAPRRHRKRAAAGTCTSFTCRPGAAVNSSHNLKGSECESASGGHL